MPSSEDLDAIAAIVARILRISPEEAYSARRGEQEGWSSLKHIEIVFQIEEEFEVQFDEEEIAQLVDIESILSALDRVRGR